jgi:hypothetical protein
MYLKSSMSIGNYSTCGWVRVMTHTISPIQITGLDCSNSRRQE